MATPVLSRGNPSPWGGFVEAWLGQLPVAVWLGAVLALYMAWAIGANDVANAMGTSVGSGALSIRGAILVAGVFEFSGALFAGGHVTDTVRKGIIDTALVDRDLLLYGMLAALTSAGTWLLLASRAGWQPAKERQPSAHHARPTLPAGDRSGNALVRVERWNDRSDTSGRLARDAPPARAHPPSLFPTPASRREPYGGGRDDAVGESESGLGTSRRRVGGGIDHHRAGGSRR